MSLQYAPGNFLFAFAFKDFPKLAGFSRTILIRPGFPNNYNSFLKAPARDNSIINKNISCYSEAVFLYGVHRNR